MDDIFELREKYIGKVYKHFKGNIYKIRNIVLDADTTKPRVIYQSISDPTMIWDRPFDDFFSDVDKRKYPKVKQKKRFEELDYFEEF